MVRWPSEAVGTRWRSTASEGHRTKLQISTGCGIVMVLGGLTGRSRLVILKSSVWGDLGELDDAVPSHGESRLPGSSTFF